MNRTRRLQAQPRRLSLTPDHGATDFWLDTMILEGRMHIGDRACHSRTCTHIHRERLNVTNNNQLVLKF